MGDQHVELLARDTRRPAPTPVRCAGHARRPAHRRRCGRSTHGMSPKAGCAVSRASIGSLTTSSLAPCAQRCRSRATAGPARTGALAGLFVARPRPADRPHRAAWRRTHHQHMPPPASMTAACAIESTGTSPARCEPRAGPATIAAAVAKPAPSTRTPTRVWRDHASVAVGEPGAETWRCHQSCTSRQRSIWRRSRLVGRRHRSTGSGASALRAWACTAVGSVSLISSYSACAWLRPHARRRHRAPSPCAVFRRCAL